MGCNLAIAGVTGAVGQEFLAILQQRDFPFDSVKMLASARSVGKKIESKGKIFTHSSVENHKCTIVINVHRLK